MSTNLLKNTDGSLSSRIVSLFIVVIFDLIIILLSLLLQKIYQIMIDYFNLREDLRICGNIVKS